MTTETTEQTGVEAETGLSDLSDMLGAIPFIDFERRCRVCESCIPESLFKKQMVRLHNEMLAEMINAYDRAACANNT